MKLRTCSLKLALVVTACVVAGWPGIDRIAARGPNTVSPADTLSPQERRGQQIFLKGEMGKAAESVGAEIRAVLINSDIDMPASAFPCANCHGRRGEGTKEGGVQTPPLTWTALGSTAKSAMTGRERGPYNDSSLKLAISLGLDPAGRPLHAAMPHYRMTAEQMTCLIAYLKILGQGKEADPGISDETIKVGAALPLTGPLAQIGSDIRATLTACFNQINAQGGIYGRRLALVVEDSRGDLQGTAAATRRLVEKEEVFALVGSFEPKGSETINDFLQSVETPMIGPVTFSPRLPAVQNGYAFYLLPSLGNQVSQLLDFASSETLSRPLQRALRLAIVYSENEIDQGTLTDVRSQAQAQKVELINEQRLVDNDHSVSTVAKSLATAKPDYVLFLGSPDHFVSLARALDQSKCDAVVLASALIIGRAGFSIPASVAARTYLAYPASLSGREDYSEFSVVMRQAGIAPPPTTFHVMAFAAAKIFTEAARTSGRQLSRVALINALEQFRDFKTGVLPPVTYGVNRRVGATGCSIVTIDLEHQRYRIVNDRPAVKE